MYAGASCAFNLMSLLSKSSSSALSSYVSWWWAMTKPVPTLTILAHMTSAVMETGSTMVAEGEVLKVEPTDRDGYSVCRCRTFSPGVA